MSTPEPARRPAGARQGHGRGWRELLFPAEPREFPYRRGLRLALRTLHIFTAGTLLGGVIFVQPWEVLQPWWHGMVISGLLLFATDLHATLTILFQLRGAVVVLKLVLVALVPALPQAALALLLAALVIGAVSSHMPGRYRHRLVLFADRLIPDQRQG